MRMPVGLSIPPSSRGGHRVAVAAVLVVIVVVLYAAAYLTGLAPWLGFAWLKRDSFGAGPLTIVGENRIGTSLGIDTFLFFKGQEILVDYDADIHAGSLWIYVYKPFDGVLGDGTATYVTESGAGQWTLPVTETAIYHVTIEPSPTRGAGRGWDLSYRAWWGARWAE
jgi:hypothetical protein